MNAIIKRKREPIKVLFVLFSSFDTADKTFHLPRSVKKKNNILQISTN